MTRKDGGPAFPSRDGGAEAVGIHTCGMTLRDYFAGQALGPIGTFKSAINREARTESRQVTDVIASFAYAVADAMLKERAK